ncbi:thioredoxin family protein [Paenibacillus albicereus]|uniref:Thioredoxin family protein n=1 Tax=Paenibacillus albicereus TaxID=2726185 RepID=A0A6H2GU58_9BACL|nr:thioredoxin family protein [Paenibacillus albicereus]QJC50922.1 thioredoxin family protein [Paenibacillus albicereus]
MGLTETSERDFMALGRIHRREALFFATPLCGTCKVAERMLEIAAAAPGAMPVQKLNVNFAPTLRERWRIASVPALALLDNGEPYRIVYAMRSAADLYEELRR